ncbi:unnamed protein product [Urochloa decumbens]|uniref:Uncharacterized protein n=1 Tax=Urochloa decumbens TaxID=240449 RepID=A0ABC9AVE1_9POAL
MGGMEAALASGVLKVAGSKLVLLIASEFASITGAKKDLCELQGKHQEISSWLAVIRDREIGSGTQFPLVNELRNVAYDIDDLLYEVHLEAEKHNIHKNGDNQPIADCFCTKPKSLLFGHKVASKIKAIKVEYDKIVKQGRDANIIRNNLQMDHPFRTNNWRAGEPSILCNVENSKIPRRDQEKGEIIRKILEPNEGEYGQTVVSIVGLGGSGKTTLAKHICHDSKIKEHFNDMVFWVHVSQEFDFTKLIGKLFEAIIEKKSDLHVQQNMLREISNKINGKKFLLILDDAWHRDKHDWEQFMLHLKSGTPGSKILLTTCDWKVAEIVKSRHIIELGLLSEAESWSLFLKCFGWIVEELGSYGSELDQLKQCFMFCSIFPKGFEIYKDCLIAQWIAHGFITEMNGMQLEDIGSAYFDSFVKVGFLHDTYKHWYTGETKMHDLIHDLTRHILEYEVVTCLPNNMTTNYTKRCRYLSLTSCAEKVNRGSFDKVHALFASGASSTSLNKLIKKSCYVHSVILQYTIDNSLSLFIMKFEYLGYLEIHGLNTTELPEAISGCWNLQALVFIECIGLVTLPESIGKLKKLRTLQLRHNTDLGSLPESVGDCQDLQSLQLYYCQKLRTISGSLGRNGRLRVLQIVKSYDLEQLPLESSVEFSNLLVISLAECCHFQGLPATLSCPTLCTLDLSRTKVTELPEWVTTIGTLKYVNLESCKELVVLPKDIGKLKALAVLNIKGCTSLRYMPPGIGQLTRLTQLGLFVVGCGGDDARISELENLDKISGDIEIQNLEYLKDPCDAEKACLKWKNSIQGLVLDWWSPSMTEEEMISGADQDLGVLNGLEPPPRVEDIEIRRYRGPCLPRWWMEQKDSSYCDGMTLKQSSPCQFLSLTKLTLSQIPNLKHMWGVLKFPSLKSLKLSKMANLEDLWTTANGFEILEEEVRAQDCFPVLSELSIRDCPKLSTMKPYFPPSLENLCLVRNNLQLLSPDNFAHLLPPATHGSSLPRCLHSEVRHLKRLQLKGMMGSSSGWEFLQHHTELETLCIRDCNNLTQLPGSIRSLTSLQKLEITGLLASLNR